MSRFFTLFNVMLITFLALPAFAELVPEKEFEQTLAMTDVGWRAFAAAFAISVAAFGGALAQGRAAAAALEGIARNPGASGAIFTPMIISLALIESLVIYALLIAFMIK